MPQLALNLDQLDDPLLSDGMPSFDGGHFSNQRANLLKLNESSFLLNCDINKLGRVRTRRGTERLGSGTGGTGSLIQGLTNFQTKDYNYPIAVNGGKLYSFDGANWNLIAQGGVANDHDINFTKIGYVNQSGGYSPGTTVINVDGFTGMVQNGQQLASTCNFKTDPVFYTIVGHTETVGHQPITDCWKICRQNLLMSWSAPK